VKIGEQVTVGATLCVIHANDERLLSEARGRLDAAIRVGEGAVVAPKLIEEMIR
jgi:thymidine phosphorylase